MATLNWIGKEKVINHHLDVPFRTLKHKYTYKDGKKLIDGTTSDNKIIHGDNLEALKSLLPEYEGKIKCIYIDPPYNTGNEGWVYNDNVNHPKIKKWLGEVVGKEGEDLSRHDKWMCMMYPRLKLLHKLLSKEGIIFVSIDDSESKNLRLLMDEIFGQNQFVEQIIWKNKYGPGALTKGFGNVHEYILCYSKSNIDSIRAPLDEEQQSKYKKKDSKYETRGGYITQPLMTRSKDDRPNLVYPIYHNNEMIMPRKQWIWSEKRLKKAIEKDEVVFNKMNDGEYSVRFKQYLRDEDGQMRTGKPISILNGPFNQEGTNEMRQIFGKKVFDNPKPKNLVKYLFSIIVNEDDDKSGIYLDSFAGSATSAHAVAQLNKEDGGDRKFILVEMEDYADDITAERVKRVIDGYGKGKKRVEGTGGDFEYLELGDALFDEDEYINENQPLEDIRKYVYYSETRTNTGYSENPRNEYCLGKRSNAAYYFYYKKEAITTLDLEFASQVTIKADQYIIYADKCTLSEEYMKKHNIIFKKIPRDITKI